MRLLPGLYIRELVFIHIFDAYNFEGSETTLIFFLYNTYICELFCINVKKKTLKTNSAFAQ